MLRTIMEYKIIFLALMLSTIHTNNGVWIAANISDFCLTAEDCIISGVESFIPLEDDDLQGRKANDVCTNHKELCHHDPDNETYYDIAINSDRERFCRIILNCYNDTLITGPTVDISTWCPYSKFCHRHPSSQIDNRDVQHSCCMHCSCEPTCGHTNNCCYNSNASYNAVESERLKCVKLDMGAYKGHGFYMKDTCRNGSKCLQPNNITGPATSQIKHRIYINEECGKCNDAVDVKPWLKFLTCTILYCQLTFQVPEPHNMAWIKQFICSDNIIRTCDPRYKYEEVKKLCYNTNAIVLNEVYMNGYLMYGNIYCIACNFITDYDSTAMCSIFDLDLSDTRTTVGLTTLLDVNVERNAIQQSKQTTGHGGSCATYMIKSLGQPGCHSVLCPNGMVRVNGGSCKYIAKKWYKVKSQVTVSLFPVDGILVPASLLRNTPRTWNLSSWIISPCVAWTDYAYTIHMLAIPASQMEVIAELKIEIVTKADEVVTEDYITGWKKCFDVPWKVVLGMKTYMFSPSFRAYDLSNNAAVLGTPAINGTIPMIYEEIYNQVRLKAYTNININKLYFCYRVELPPEEVSVSKDRSTVRLLHNNMTLGRNEFDIVWEGPNDVLVCVEDYQYLNRPSTAASSTYFTALTMSLFGSMIIST